MGNIKQQLKTLGITNALICDGDILAFDNFSGFLLKYNCVSDKTDFLCKISEKFQPYIFKILKYRGSLFMFDRVKARVYEYINEELLCHTSHIDGSFSGAFRKKDNVIMSPVTLNGKLGEFSLEKKEFKFSDISIKGVNSNVSSKEIVYPFAIGKKIYMPISGTNVIISYRPDDGVRKDIYLGNDVKISRCGYEPHTNSLIVSKKGNTGIFYYDCETLTAQNKWNEGQCLSLYYSRFICVDEYTIGLPGEDSNEIVFINNNTKKMSRIDISEHVTKQQKLRNVSKVVFALKYGDRKVIMFPHNLGEFITVNMDDLSTDYHKVFVDSDQLWNDKVKHIIYEDQDNYSLENYINFITE